MFSRTPQYLHVNIIIVSSYDLTHRIKSMNIVDHRMSVWGEILLYILMGTQRQKRTMLFKLGKQVSPEVGTGR